MKPYNHVKKFQFYPHYNEEPLEYFKQRRNVVSKAFRGIQKIELPSDPAIPLLGVYPEKTIIRKDTHTPITIAALFTISRTWKPPKCPSIEEWIKKMWYIYTVEYYSDIKKE